MFSIQEIQARENVEAEKLKLEKREEERAMSETLTKQKAEAIAKELERQYLTAVNTHETPKKTNDLQMVTYCSYKGLYVIVAIFHVYATGYNRVQILSNFWRCKHQKLLNVFINKLKIQIHIFLLSLRIHSARKFYPLPSSVHFILILKCRQLWMNLC